jgi:hypothetical protein
VDISDHALQHSYEALAARVYHPGFLEHGQELGRSGQRQLAFLQQTSHELAHIA